MLRRAVLRNGRLVRLQIRRQLLLPVGGLLRGDVLRLVWHLHVQKCRANVPASIRRRVLFWLDVRLSCDLRRHRFEPKPQPHPAPEPKPDPDPEPEPEP